jgi:hypothetical protein
MNVCVVIDAYDVIDIGDAIDTCDAIDTSDDCDIYRPIAICVHSSCLLCINAIVGSARLLRHDTPGHESDRRIRRRMLKKLVASLASAQCQSAYVVLCAHAAR